MPTGRPYSPARNARPFPVRPEPMIRYAPHLAAACAALGLVALVATGGISIAPATPWAATLGADVRPHVFGPVSPSERGHLRVGDTHIRLRGVAIPKGARDAADFALGHLTAGAEVRCLLDSGQAGVADAVGVCYARDEDIGRALVRGGVARACPTPARRALGLPPRYRRAERRALADDRPADPAHAVPLPDRCEGDPRDADGAASDAWWQREVERFVVRIGILDLALVLATLLALFWAMGLHLRSSLRRALDEDGKG